MTSLISPLSNSLCVSWLCNSLVDQTGSDAGKVALADGKVGNDMFKVGTTGISVVILGTLVIKGGFCPNSQGWRPERGVGWKRSLHYIV